MSLARSAIQPLRIISHSRYNVFSTTTLPGCRLCNVRHYSDQQEALQRQFVSEQHQIATSTSSSSSKKIYQGEEPKGEKPERASFSSLLFPDDVDLKPGLSALDELNPSNNKLTSSYTKSKTPRNQFEVWKRTLDRVKESFTIRQLEDMMVEADLPVSILNQYKGKRNYKTKAVRAKALMTHRFGMQDPELQAEREAARAKKFQRSKSIELPVSQIALLLLVLRGQSELQRLLQLNRVKVRPSKREGDDSLALYIQGTEQGIEIVQEWILSFIDKIQSAFFPLSSLSVSREAVQVPDEHRLRSISRLSRSIVSLDDKGANVTIHSVDDASLEAAQSLLVQSLHDDQQSQKRQMYSYASPPIPSDTFVSIPTYGFIPCVGSSPVSWLFDPGLTTSLFRITRQDIIDADEQAFSEQDNLDKPFLRSLNSIETYDSSRSTSLSDNIFVQLQDRAQIQNKSSGSWTFTAEFGHLLFNNHDQASESKVLSLITPPVAGTWPLEHGLEWLRNSIQRDVLAAPSFNSCLPPLAANLDAGTVPSQGSTQPSKDGNDADADEDSGERIIRTNQHWSESLRQFGFHLQTNKLHKLYKIVDLETPRFVEDLVITFTGSKADLQIRLRETMEEDRLDSTGLIVDEAKWVQRINADVLVPESSVDVRLGVVHSKSVEESALMKDAGLKQYLEEQRESNSNKILSTNSEESIDVEERPVALPRTAVVEDEKLFLISARRICRWEWDILDKKVASFQAKLVLERGAQDDAGENRSAFKVSSLKVVPSKNVADFISLQIEFKENEESAELSSDVEEGGEISEQHVNKVEKETYQNSSQRDAKSVPSWKIVQPLVNYFLAKGYRALQG